MDERQHAFQIAIDFIVPETQSAKTFAGKMIVRLRVAPGMRIEIMLTAIDLDNEAVLTKRAPNYHRHRLMWYEVVGQHQLRARWIEVRGCFLALRQLADDFSWR